jgi:hypothetical protein
MTYDWEQIFAQGENDRVEFKFYYRIYHEREERWQYTLEAIQTP